MLSPTVVEKNTFLLSGYDYHLPRELIAQHPLEQRDQSRLFVLHRLTEKIEHRKFLEVTYYLRPGDLLVFNDTKVIPARLVGQRSSGGRIEVLLLGNKEGNKWCTLINARGKIYPGEEFSFEGGAVRGILVEKTEGTQWIIDFKTEENFFEVLNEVGRMPLPPYIKRSKTKDEFSLEDRERYQTVFARKPGSVAAPTAGLHFTPKLLEELGRRGVKIAFITLHVGLGTFQPIQTQDITKHVMHKEYYELTAQTAEKIKDTRKAGGRLVAVGSSSCRVLETLARGGGIKASSGWTDLFIYPPYEFNVVDALITNFHLPKTTLLTLVAAFAGRERVFEAYRVAIKEKYRFYSYGDCMLIL